MSLLGSYRLLGARYFAHCRNIFIRSRKPTFLRTSDSFFSTHHGRLRTAGSGSAATDIQYVNSPEVPVSPDTDGKKSASQLFKLLRKHIGEKDLEETNNLLKEIDTASFIYSGSMCASLLNFFCQNQNLERAMHFKEILDKDYPHFRIDCYKIFRLAALLADNNKFQDAENLITSYHSDFGKHPVYINNVCQVLNSFAKSEDKGMTRRLFEQLVELGFCVPSRPLLEPLIATYISKNDILGAVDEYLRIVQTYKCTPSKHELLSHLIQLEDPEALQKVLDATASVEGEAMTALTLAQLLNNCGKLEQALKVIKAFDVHNLEGEIYAICDKYFNMNKIKELETFLQVTKDISGLDRDYMFYRLLKAYVKTDNVEKALSVWNMMQEENVEPRDRTLTFLGKFLQRMNEPIPFTMPPEKSADIPQEQSNTVSQEETNEETMNQQQSVKGLSFGEASRLIDDLVKEDKLQEAVQLVCQTVSNHTKLNQDTLSNLFYKLSIEKDIINLTHLEAHVPERLLRQVPYDTYLANCFVESNKAEEFLNVLENEIPKYIKHFPLQGILYLLQQQPSLVEPVKGIADMYYQEGNSLPKKMLWMHLMNCKQFEEADKIFNSIPDMKRHLFFWSVLKHIKSTNDIEVSQKLLDTINNTYLSDRQKGIVISAHLNVLVSLNKLTEALDVLKNSCKTINIQYLNKGGLQRLKENLATQGISAPFQIPQQHFRDRREKKTS